ncbi:PREDICTED: divergent paired-related homeobox [Chrysochloris asiatica]|uniref:Divergent paired-related homeobox n=1 Tax=Chrysochloris asiatica TaxID=185453 RepID=A0A9B0TXB2_CHRAS|nr:PREDICTED: divergent paired-related homeobox [Chrysochloris asiatica]
MANQEDPPTGKHWKHPERRRTMFTAKQLEELKLLFYQNPYPSYTLKKETASKLGVHPTALQVWFKNYRAKLKKAKCRRYIQRRQQQDADHQQSPETWVPKSPSKGNMDAPSTSCTCTCTCLGSLVYTDHLAPSFQLSICPNLKVPTDHSAGHKIVHFGCCQDPNIYCLRPIVKSQVLSPSLESHS